MTKSRRDLIRMLRCVAWGVFRTIDSTVARLDKSKQRSFTKQEVLDILKDLNDETGGYIKALDDMDDEKLLDLYLDVIAFIDKR